MIEQRSISVHDTTYEYFINVKVQYQAKVKKILLHDDFVLEMLKCIIEKEGLIIE